MTRDNNFETGQADASNEAADQTRSLREEVLAANTSNERLALVGDDPRVLAAILQPEETT